MTRPIVLFAFGLALARPTVAGVNAAPQRPRETPALGFATGYVACESAVAQPGAVRALLIGVSHDGVGPPVEGPLGDVKLLGDAVRRRARDAQITQLADPSQEDVASALNRLVEATRCRDFVFILLSGNGGAYASDELGRDDFVLFGRDAFRREQNDGSVNPSNFGLRGKDLAAAVLALRNRGAFVFVAIDAARAGLARLTADGSPESVWRISVTDRQPVAPKLAPGAGGLAVFGASGRRSSISERRNQPAQFGSFSFAIAAGMDSGAPTLRDLANRVADSLDAASGATFLSTEPERGVLVPGDGQASGARPTGVGRIKLVRPEPTKGLNRAAAADVEVEAEALGAVRLEHATINDAKAVVEGRRMRARIHLAPGPRYITISAVDASSRPYSGTFEIQVADDMPKGPRGKSVAVLIANAHYLDPKWGDLPFPEIEIRGLQQVLESRYGFEATSLKDRDGKEIPLVLVDQNKATIIQTLEAVAGMLGESDQMLVYYSGHGWKPDKSAEAFWVPRDARGKVTYTYISSDEISKTFQLSDVGHWLVIADSCYSGCMWGVCGEPKAEHPVGPREADPGYDDGVLRINGSTPSRHAFTSGANQPVPSKRFFNEHLLTALNAPPKQAFLGNQLHAWIQAGLAGEKRDGAVGQVSLYFVIPTGGGKQDADFAFFKSLRGTEPTSAPQANR